MKDSLPVSYVDHDPIVINSNQSFANQHWPGSGTEEDPYVIAGLNITSNDICIFIYGTSVHFIIRNCIISSDSTSEERGIALTDVQHGSVESCVVSLHHIGVDIASCNNCSMRNNTISEGFTGIRLWYSEYCTLINNVFTDNAGYGIRIADCSNCTLQGNTANDNGMFGFRLNNADRMNLTKNVAANNGKHGFEIGYLLDSHSEWLPSDDCILHNNAAIGNGDSGYLLVSTRNCRLVENKASENNYGMYMSGDARTNLVYLNALFNNTINGFDNGTLNRWDNGTHGNYWGDYDGTGPYDVPGPAQSADENPFVYGLVPPRIDQPADVEYEVGSTGHSIQWHPSASHPDSYDLFVNGTLIESGEWVDNNFTVDIDGRDVGVYNYTLIVRDITGNTAQDTVMVVVKPSALSDNPFLHPLALFLTLLGVSIAAVFGVLLVRHRLGRHTT
jgi:parallel beta-helix repeat protein